MVSQKIAISFDGFCTFLFFHKKPKDSADQNIQTYSKKKKFTKFYTVLFLSPIIQELKTGGKVTTRANVEGK
jgi:hypothetical protein